MNLGCNCCQPWINKPHTAVSVGGHHLSIRLLLLREYPLINKPWFINPGLTLLHVHTNPIEIVNTWETYIYISVVFCSWCGVCMPWIYTSYFMCIFGLYKLRIGHWKVIFGLTLGTGGMQLIRMSELKKKGEKFVESRTFFVLGMVTWSWKTRGVFSFFQICLHLQRLDLLEISSMFFLEGFLLESWWLEDLPTQWMIYQSTPWKSMSITRVWSTESVI